MARKPQDKPSENLSGKKFNMLSVVKFVKKDKGRFYYEVECDCGNKKVMRSDSIKVNKHCGGDTHKPEGPELQMDRVEVLKKEEYYQSIIRRSKKLNSQEDNIISFEEFSNIVDKECYYCEEKGSKIRKDKYSNTEILINGIDRMDNNLGYITKNVVSCCKWCNYSKHESNISYFANWIYRTYNYMILHKKIDINERFSPLQTTVRPNTKGKIRKKDRENMLYKNAYNKLKQDTKKMGRSFKVSFEKYKILIVKPCKYCGREYSREIIDGSTKKSIKINSLDRINSNVDYYTSNIQVTCVTCNYAKNNRDEEKFKEHVKSIYPFALKFISKLRLE
ncbi:hypothetical protein [Clostridium sp.]|uniref:hypothetical protein n=1 Tax=Clostridium sp. TaxID=1506 RepID=UPI002FCB7AB4